MGHKQFILDPLSPITVIIGDNDTGKTSILKMLYATAKSLEIYSRKNESFKDFNNGESFKKILSEKIFDTFQPKKGNIGELVTKGSKDKLSVDIRFQRLLNEPNNYTNDIYFSFGENTTRHIVDCNDTITKTPEDFFNALFISPKEVLTAFKAIKFTRKPNFLFGFDDTHLDLIDALEIPTQKGKTGDAFGKINKQLEALFEGIINQSDKEEPFVFKKGNTEFSMSLTAEGIKRIGILTTLIRNKQLNSNTILFFDEIETALHPKAIRQVVEMIVALSKAGVQIILSTHSYFVIKQFVICAKREDLTIDCVSLEKNDKQNVGKLSDLKDGMPSNPIVDEALKMFDEEVELDFK